jgi:uncharacterized protein YodC (DUF2158 family)
MELNPSALQNLSSSSQEVAIKSDTPAMLIAGVHISDTPAIDIAGVSGFAE